MMSRFAFIISRRDAADVGRHVAGGDARASVPQPRKHINRQALEWEGELLLLLILLLVLLSLLLLLLLFLPLLLFPL